MATAIIWNSLEELARAARECAYAPYSNFKVGAAVLASSGQIYSGSNVENGSYGLTLCAERNAVARAISQGERQLSAMVIVADSQVPVMPCGACRQFIAEFAPNLPILCVGQNSVRQETSLERLLPMAFVKPQKV
jgi:cytidine deaminase